MHTEDEAKKLCCPFKLHDLQKSSPENTCEASNCMAWRWVVSSQEETHYLGYCGLSGKPFD